MTRRGGQRGAAAVETALTLPVFVLFVFAVVELARMVWIDNSLRHASDQAARFAMARPAASMAEVAAAGEGAAAALRLPEAACSAVRAGAATEVSCSLVFSSPFASLLPDPVVLERRSRVLDQPST